MATVSSNMTECPQCFFLCLGALILRCGHAACQHCMLKLRQKKASCTTCGQKTFDTSLYLSLSQAAQLHSSDLVVRDQVMQLLKKGNRCQACHRRSAVCLCRKCRELYCSTCSDTHRAMFRHHPQESLISTLLSEKTVNENVFLSRAVKADTRFAGWESDNPTQHAEEDPDETFRVVMWVRDQKQALQNVHDAVQEVLQFAETFGKVAEQLSENARTKQILLNAYLSKLRTASVTVGGDVTGLSESDVTATTRYQDLRRRLEDVSKTDDCIDLAERLKDQMKKLLKSVGKIDDVSQEQQRAISSRTVYDTTDLDPDLAHGHQISDMLVLKDGRLVLAVQDSDALVIVSERNPYDFIFFRLGRTPHCLAALSKDEIAVTVSKKSLVFLKGSLNLHSVIKTAKAYVGVARGPDDDTLIVSCLENKHEPAAIDIIRRDGSLLETVITADNLEGLQIPERLCIISGCVVIYNEGHDSLHFVELSTGTRSLPPLENTLLESIARVSADERGNLYMIDKARVLMFKSDGNWRLLLSRPVRNDLSLKDVCATRSGMVVRWGNDPTKDQPAHCVVIEYELL